MSIKVLLFAAFVGLLIATISDFFTDRSVVMCQFIITLGILLYAEIINELQEIRSEVNKNEYYRKKNKSKKQ